MSFVHALAEISLWVVAIALLLVLVVASEAGFRLGERHARRGGVDDRQLASTATLIGGMLAMLAFALGLTISFAENRYEGRRLLVVQEANTIGTAWLRARLVGGDEGNAIAALIEDYTRVRIEYTSAGLAGPVSDLIAKTGVLQTKMWGVLTPLARRTPTPIVASLMSALNDMFDASLAQRMAFESRVPESLATMLMVGSVLALGAMGFQFGLAGTRQVTLSLLLLSMWVGAIVLIVDFNRPRLGALRVDVAPLVWTLQGFGTAPK